MSRAVTPVPPARAARRDAYAVIVAYLPFALALGASMAATGLPPVVAWASSPLLFGGAAQLLAVQQLDAGAGAAVVIAAALVVNARMLLYGASLAPHVRGWRGRWRWAGAYLLADPVYAMAVGRFGRPDEAGDDRDRLTYYFVAGGTLWVAWMLATGAGVALAGALPVELRLELAAPLTFLLLLAPMITDRPTAAAAVTGGVVAVAASGLPLGLGLLTGAAAGIVVGALTGAVTGAKGGGRRA